MKDKLRISPNGYSFLSPFILRNAKNTVTYGVILGNQKAKTPMLRSSKVYTYNPETQKMHLEGNLGSLINYEATSLYESAIMSSNFRATFASNFKPSSSSFTKTKTKELRRAHYPRPFISAVHSKWDCGISRS